MFETSQQDSFRIVVLKEDVSLERKDKKTLQVVQQDVPWDCPAVWQGAAIFWPLG
jgi:hypothetical protein